MSGTGAPPRVGRNLVWSGLGWLAPAVLALVSIPVFVHRLGVDRFGALGLAWTLVGYFGLFDLGLGRAVTQLVAARLGQGRHEELPPLVWTALWLMVPLALAGGVAVYVSAPWLVRELLRVPAPLQAETVAAFRLLALATPFTVHASGLRGVLEGQQAFGAVAALRVPVAVTTFAVPILVLPYRATLPAVVGALALGRVLVWAFHVATVRRVAPALARVRRPVAAQARPILALGGWMTVSNIVSPLMTSLDRFAVGAVLSMAAVAHYTTASEVVTRLWIVTAVVLPVFFPAIAAAVHRDEARAARLFDQSVRLTLALAVPAALVLSCFAPEWLALWIGADVARHAAPLAQGLAAAVVVNVLGQAAYTVVQASGRADFTGRLHVAELPLYAAALWWLLHAAGAAGVVCAWGLRVLVDTAVLVHAAGGALPAARPALRRAVALTACAAAACLLPLVAGGLGGRATVAAVGLAAYAVYAWRVLVGADGRALLGSLPARLRRGAAATEERALAS